MHFNLIYVINIIQLILSRLDTMIPILDNTIFYLKTAGIDLKTLSFTINKTFKIWYRLLPIRDIVLNPQPALTIIFSANFYIIKN